MPCIAYCFNYIQGLCHVIIFCIIIPFQHVTFCLNNKYILYNELVIIKCFKVILKYCNSQKNNLVASKQAIRKIKGL